MGKPLKQALWDLGAWLTMRILNQPLLLNQLTFGTKDLIKVVEVRLSSHTLLSLLKQLL